MDSLNDSSLDDLVARRTVEDFGGLSGFSIIKVPGWSTLTDSEKIKVCAKLERQRHIVSPQVNSALLSRIQEMTPPPDCEAEKEESRSIEDQARKDLEKEGCPPCYPTDLQFPLRDIPEKYQGIVSFWKSLPGTGDVVLRAQLSDWGRFRGFQRKIRRYYRNKSLSELEEKVQERRRKHGLGGDVRLQSDSEQQSQLENWIEFQNYHLHIHEGLEKERDDLKQELDIARTKFEGVDAADLEQMLEATERQFRRHKNLVQWIEEERAAIDAMQPTFIEGDHDNHGSALKAVRRLSKFDRRKRQPHAVLGEVRVSKPEPQKRNIQRRKHKAPEAEPAVENPAPPQSNISRNPNSREGIKKDAALRQIFPQKVSKVKRLANATKSSAKSPPAVPLRRARQKRETGRAQPKHQQSPQRSKPAPIVARTRSGRASRRPERPWFLDR